MIFVYVTSFKVIAMGSYEFICRVAFKTSCETIL